MFGGGDGDSSIQRFHFRPEDLQRMDGFARLLSGNMSTANAAANDASKNTLTDYAKFDPRMITSLGGSLDNISQQQVSQGLQGLAQAANQRNAAITQQVGVRNPGLANVLRFQNQFSNANAGNGLNFAALNSQIGREQANNAARLAQSQQQANLQQLGNAAWGQKAQLGQQPFQNTLLGLAGSTAYGSATGEKQTLSLDDYKDLNGLSRRGGL